MAHVDIVFETHSTSEDNERGGASGWNHSRLSEAGREEARKLGARRRDDGLAVVLTSDLQRAVETAATAFEGTRIPVLHDWRLRECDYGEMNGRLAEQVHGDREQYLDSPYPGGETWRQAVGRVGRVFDDLLDRWEGERVLLIGHIATRLACEHFLRGEALEELLREDFRWQDGWEYRYLP